MAIAHQVSERAPSHQLHPETHAVADLHRAVYGDDVRMMDARQQAPLVNDRGCVRTCAAGPRGNELEGNLAIQTRIPRAVHVAAGAASDRLEELQRSLHGRSFAAQATLVRWMRRRRQFAVAARNSRDDLELAE